METIDLAILLLVLWAAFTGWRRGLLKEIVSMCGFFVGLLVAYLLYTQFGDLLAPSISSHGGVGRFVGSIVAFIIIWVAVPIVLGVVANVLTRSMKAIHFGKLNSLGGATVSVVKYLILMSFVFSAMNFLGIMSSEKRQASWFYEPVSNLAGQVFSGKKRPQASEEQQGKTDTLWVNVHHPKGAGQARK
jgi:uncharacterized membrane protein required for colicin V production